MIGARKFGISGSLRQRAAEEIIIEKINLWAGFERSDDENDFIFIRVTHDGCS